MEAPSELVAYLLPVALVLQILHMYQRDYLYKRLPPIANHILVVIYPPSVFLPSTIL